MKPLAHSLRKVIDKPSRRFVLFLSLLFIASPPIAGTVFVYDPFPTSATQTTGFYTENVGLNDSHNANVPATLGTWNGYSWKKGENYKAVSTGLTYTDPIVTERKLVTTGGAVEYTRTNPYRINRQFLSNALSGDTYFSFLIRIDTLAASTCTGRFGLSYTISSGALYDYGIARIDMSTGELKAQCYDTVNSTDTFTLATDKTYLVVGRIEFDVNANDDERLTLFVNPRLGAGEGDILAEKTIVVTANTTRTPVKTWYCVQGNGSSSSGLEYVIDELRATDNWDEAVPYVTGETDAMLLYEAFPTAASDTFRKYTAGSALNDSHNRSMTATAGSWGAGGWNHGQSNDVSSTGLTYTDTNPTPDLVLDTEGGSIAYNGTSYTWTNRQIRSTPIAKTAYFSYLLRIDDYSATGVTGRWGLGFLDTNNGLYEQATCRVTMSTGELKAACNGSVNTQDTYTLQEDTTYLVVGKLELDYDGNGNDRTTLWIDPRLGKREADAAYAAKLVATGSTTRTPSKAYWICGCQNSTVPDVSFDELRVGHSWEAVTPATPSTSGYLNVSCEWDNTYGAKSGVRVTDDDTQDVLMQAVSTMPVLNGMGSLTSDMTLTEVTGGFDLKVALTNPTSYPHQLPTIRLSGLQMSSAGINYISPRDLGKQGYYSGGDYYDYGIYPHRRTYSPLWVLWDNDFAAGVCIKYDMLKYRNGVLLEAKRGGATGYFYQFKLAGNTLELSRIPGDMDRDGDLDNDDATVFADALSDPKDWKQTEGSMYWCPQDYADFNGDGRFDSDDQAGFDAQLSGGPTSEIRGAWIPAGATYTYTISMRFTETSSPLLAVENYRQFFRSKYGAVRYVADREPVFGTSAAMQSYCSDTNPRGFTSTRVDLNGWGTFVDNIENNAHADGYRRFMIWEGAGCYRTYSSMNMAYEIMSEWSTPMVNSADEWDDLTDSRIGFWWGRNMQVSSGWDTGVRWIHDPANSGDNSQADDELGLFDDRGLVTVGLDASVYPHLQPQMRMRLLEYFQSTYPDLKFIVEPLCGDLVHTRAPMFTSFSNQNQAAVLADWLNPGHETWVRMTKGAGTWSTTNFNSIRSWGMVPVPMHYSIDVATIVPLVKGDFNGDGAVNGLDIPGFKAALADPAGWQASTGRDPNAIGDFNGDGTFNGLDIPGFKSALAGG